MFFIYSLDLKDNSVKLYDFCHTKEGVTDLLNTVATNFIARECGERVAENAFRDDTPNEEIEQDGYFLRHSAEHPNQIDVYQRKTSVNAGMFLTSVDVTCECVSLFSVTEASLGLPIECTGKGVTTPTFNNAKEQHDQTDHIEALKQRLVAQREKVEQQIANDVYDYHDLPPLCKITDSDSESEEMENPKVVLRKRMIAEWDNVPTPQPQFATFTDAPKPTQPELLDLDELLEELISNEEKRIPTPPPLPLPHVPMLPEVDYSIYATTGPWDHSSSTSDDSLDSDDFFDSSDETSESSTYLDSDSTLDLTNDMM